MKINRIFIFITMAVVFFSMSSALPAHDDVFDDIFDDYDLTSDCSNDDHCRDSERCDNKKCTSACDPYPCGTGTYCDTKNHQAQCECLYECKGDPLIKCERMSDEEIYNKVLSEFGKEGLEAYLKREIERKKMMQQASSIHE